MIEVRIIYFDGICVLCNGFVKWIIERDADKKFKFSTIGSPSFEALAQKNPELRGVDSIVYHRGENVFLRGRAVREIIHDLSTHGLIKLSVAVTPLFLLNTGYKLIAKTRYKIFGKYDACPLPRAEWRDRFED